MDSLCRVRNHSSYYPLNTSQIAKFMGPTWGLSAPCGPHVGPMNLVIRDCSLNVRNISEVHGTHSARTCLSIIIPNRSFHRKLCVVSQYNKSITTISLYSKLKFLWNTSRWGKFISWIACFEEKNHEFGTYMKSCDMAFYRPNLKLLKSRRAD